MCTAQCFVDHWEKFVEGLHWAGNPSRLRWLAPMGITAGNTADTFLSLGIWSLDVKEAAGSY